MISDFETEKEYYKKEREKHMKMLEEFYERGKKHPEIEKG